MATLTTTQNGLNFTGGTTYIQTGTTKIMSIKVDGNVGIGTTSPQSKLHIETGSGGTYNPNTNHDDLTIEGSGNIGLQLFSPASSYQYIAFGDPDSVNAGYLRYYHGTNEMVFRTNGSDKMVIEDNGNVGIGTTSPAAKLHVDGEARVYGSGSTYYVNMNANSSWGYFNTNAPKIYINKEIQVDTGLIGSYNEDLQLRTQGSTKMYISNSNGNVGIGTTSPSYKLSVNGDIQSDFLRSYQYPTVSFLDFDDDTMPGSNGTALVSVSSMKFIIDSNNNATIDAFSWITDGLPGSGSTLMTLTDEGLLGIGTISPTGKLDVREANVAISTSNSMSDGIRGLKIEGTNAGVELAGSGNDWWVSALGSGLSIYDTTANAYRLKILNNGNIGIGTTNPTDKLDVSGNIKLVNTQDYIKFANDFVTLKRDSDNSMLFNAYAGFKFFDTQASSERMRITSSGNVGIGTTSPTYKLHVAGTTYANGSVIGSSDLWLRDQSSAYSTELKMQNNTHTIGIDYQNNETLRFITRSGVTTVPITFQMRAGTITAANFILSSDERKKTKIADLSCDNIDVSWKSFEMKDNEGEYRTGVVAQELEQKHPEFVNTNDEGFKSVKYIDLLIAKIAELEARLEELEK